MNAQNPPTLCDKYLYLLATLKNFEVDIRRALEYTNGNRSFDSLIVDVLANRLHMYPLRKSLILAEVCDDPNGRVYHIYLAAGDLDEILGYVPALHEHARSYECIRLGFSGRRGWVKPLTQLGWKEKSVYAEVEVDGQER